MGEPADSGVEMLESALDLVTWLNSREWFLRSETGRARSKASVSPFLREAEAIFGMSLAPSPVGDSLRRLS
jgi:hypothetical protein